MTEVHSRKVPHSFGVSEISLKERRHWKLLLLSVLIMLVQPKASQVFEGFEFVA